MDELGTSYTENDSNEEEEEELLMCFMAMQNEVTDNEFNWRTSVILIIMIFLYMIYCQMHSMN